MASWRLCIVAAGKGSRVETFTKVLNKALLPVHGKAVISWILEAYPEDVEVVIALGYLGEQIRTFVTTAYPNRTFIFVEVDNWDKPGSGPGYSLLCCRPYLHSPFVYASVDALIAGMVPAPVENWFGVYPVDDTTRFCSVRIDENRTVVRIDDKIKTDNKYAFIGVAGIKDHEEFFEALSGNRFLIAGEHQVSNGFQALLKRGLAIRVLDWYDTGVPATYEDTCRRFPRNPV